MMDTKTKIAAGLEAAFAKNGFAETGVDALREASGVSLRTLYKYCPSRDDMVIAALDHRHARYMAHLFGALPKNDAPSEADDATLTEILNNVGIWMMRESPHGCLCHSAVAAHPHNAALHNMLQTHKTEVAQNITRHSTLSPEAAMLLHEGITYSWPFLGPQAVQVARDMARGLRHAT